MYDSSDDRCLLGRGWSDELDGEFAARELLPKVREKLFAHRSRVWTDVGVRLDIPSARRGQRVLSIHDKPRGGRVIGYDYAAIVVNAKFHVQPAGQRAIGAEGRAKYPMAYIGGMLCDTFIARDDDWLWTIPVYYDPRTVHLFVDRRSMVPIQAAEQVVCNQWGVWASGPKFYDNETVPPPPQGMTSLVSVP